MDKRANVAQVNGRNDSGQASVELLAVIPLIAILGLGVWQAALAARSAVLAEVAARAAARATAIGTDARAAAYSSMPEGTLATIIPGRGPSGVVRARVGVPLVIGSGRLGAIEASSAFAGQGR